LRSPLTNIIALHSMGEPTTGPLSPKQREYLAINTDQRVAGDHQ
jgi:hypothetical protein